MGCLIQDHLKKSNYFYDHHRISFAAQDNEWERALEGAYGDPTGILQK
jgi:hypothetical protein